MSLADKYYHNVYCFLANKFSDIDTFYISLLYNENKLLFYISLLFMRNHQVSLSSLLIIFIIFLFACSRPEWKIVADRLNTASYEYHYRNLDSSLIYAERAYNASESHDYSSGKAEALNNEAFVYMARMTRPMNY